MSHFSNPVQAKIFALSLIGGFCLGVSSNALAAGWYNMPTSLQQCVGYGYGPGYHSPMILGPRLAAGSEAKRVVYVPRAPVSRPQGNGFCESTCVEPPCGGMDHFGAGQYDRAMPMMAPTNYMSPASYPTLAPSMQVHPTLTPPMLTPSTNSEAALPAREANRAFGTRGSHPWHR